MRRRAAIGIDDDLAPGQAAVPVGAAGDELAGRVHVEFGFRAHPAVRQRALHDRPEHSLDLGLLEVRDMLGGDHDTGRPRRLAVDVAQRHLALGIGQQARDRLVVDVPQLVDTVQDGVGVVDRRRHQRLGLAAGIAEHHALVAGALVLVAGGVHTLRDIGRLRVQVAGDLSLVPTEAGLVVADVVDRHAGQMGQQVRSDRGRAAGLAGEHHAVGGDQCLAGDTRVGIGREVSVQHRVAEPVGHLVGMTVGDGFGGEQEFARIAHGWVLSCRRGWAAAGGGRCVAESPLGVKYPRRERRQSQGSQASRRLHGRVHRARTLQLATRLARSVTGVRRV